MYTLTKEFRFEASHQLMHHDGKCARLHGHSWVGRVILTFGDHLASTGPKKNMAMDYADIKAELAPLVAQSLDHYHLNDTLANDSPTSEFVAKWVYDRLAPKLRPYLLAVEIDETCTSSCRYEPRQHT